MALALALDLALALALALAMAFLMNEAEKLTKGSVNEDDLYIVHNDLVLMTSKEKINWLKQKGYLHNWFLPLNGLQDGTPYAGHPVGNSPEFMPLDNIHNRDILQSLRFHCVLSLSVIDGKEIMDEESKLCFSFSTPWEIAQGLKRLWDSKMGTPCSARIIQYVDLDLKALEIVYSENGAAFEGLADRNGHRRKVVGKGKSVRCGGAWTKGEGCECELAKNMLFHSDLLKLCLMKRRKITLFFPDTTVFTIKKLTM